MVEATIETVAIRKICVLGSGAFGTAVANFLIDDDLEVIIYGIDEREISDINKNHKNSKYYSVKLNKLLKATSDKEIAFKDVDLFIIGTPSFAIKSLVKEVTDVIEKPAYWINLSKGFDYENNTILFESIKGIIPEEYNNGILKLSGPTFAIEVANQQPTFFLLSSDSLQTSKSLVKYFNKNNIVAYPSANVEAVEMVSVIKNSYAIFMGMISGLGFKMNTKALFFSLVIMEIRSIMNELGYEESVLFSPAGMGDIFLTSTSRKSRNYKFGYKIGKANKITKNIIKTSGTIEGLKSIDVIFKMKSKTNLDLDLLEMLYNIINNKYQPLKTVEDFIISLEKRNIE